MTAKKYPVHLMIEALRAGLPARGTVLERSCIRAIDERVAFFQWRIVDCGAVYAPIDYERANPGESHGELLRVEPLNLELRCWDPCGGHDEEAAKNVVMRDSAIASAADPTVKMLGELEARAAARMQAPGAWGEWEADELSYGVLFSHVRVVPVTEAAHPGRRGELDVEQLPPIANAVRSTP